MTLFEYLKIKSSDINEHLETLKNLASECDHVTEMGVRYIVSTWAFVEGMKGGTLVSIDIKHPKEYGGDLDSLVKACKDKGIDFTFREADTTKIKIDKTDLLFIDTDHTYKQLETELKIHAGSVRKYIVIHDTVSCETELMPAINEFLESGVWRVKEHYKNNNGIMILMR